MQNKILYTTLVILGVLLCIFLSYQLANWYASKYNINLALVGKNTISTNDTKEKKFEEFENAFNQNNFLIANKLADEALANNSNDIQNLLMKASVLAQQASVEFKEKEFGDLAREFAEKALALDPKNTETLRLVGYTYEIQENYVKAHEYYDKALAIDPKNTQVLTQKAHAFDLQGKYNEALEMYKKSYSLDQNNLKTLSGYARILQNLGNNDESIDLYKLVLSKSENLRTKAEAAHAIGSIYQEKNYSKDAENYFIQASEIDPSFAQPYVGLAKESFKRALETKDLNKKRELIDISLGHLETALKLHPNLSIASLQLAIIMYTIGEVEFSRKIIGELLNNKIASDITLDAVSKEKMRIYADALQKSFK